MKVLVYTVNLGAYDSPERPGVVDKGFDYLCITDSKKPVPGWDSLTVELGDDILRQSRDIKINIHKYVDGYDVYVYIDGNGRILRSILEYMKRYYKGGILFQTHYARNCTYQEANKVISLGFDTKETVAAQMYKYQRSGLPRNNGLYENGFLIRDNSANEFCERWYDEILAGSYRDQLSLPYCIFKERPPKMTIVNGSYKRRYISFKPHGAPKRMPIAPESSAEPPKVWYFTPGRGDKNLGRAYNDHCALVPDGDWICIMDGDVIFLNPFWSKQIEDIIILNGMKYPLISCVTNRLGLKWQLPYGFSEDPNILNHAKIADEHFDKYYAEVVPSTKETAGLFMLFPKSTWDKVKFEPGLTNGGNFVDFTFANAVLKKLGKIGIAKGLYLFHFYRFNRKSKRDINHLL